MASLIFNSSRLYVLKRLSSTPPIRRPTLFSSYLKRPFCTSSSSSAPPKRNTLVNYSPSDSDDDDEEEEVTSKSMLKTQRLDKSTLPPPYDPFSKKPVIEQPEDPKNLQQVFHDMRSGNLFNDAVKMFDGLSKEGLTHEALELFGQIKDKGQMPEVVAHTAVMEAYMNAGQVKEGFKVYLRMLASGVLPNVYTYGVLIKGLVESGDEKMVKEAKKCVEEMLKRGMKPNAAVCVGVYQGFLKVGKADQAREVLEMVKSKGVAPEEGKVREALKGKRGQVFREILNILYG